jgi:hypothetical protein
MKKLLVRLTLLGVLGAIGAVTALAQNPTDDSTPPFLQIVREEVKPGKGTAHEGTETAWAAAMAKNKMTFGWLGSTSLTGPSEAWYFTGLASWEEWGKNIKAEADNAALKAEVEKIQAQDGDLLSRTSNILARFRPSLSYQPKVNLAQMRYMRVQLVRVKPGHGRDFADTWEEVAKSHEKAKMDEHWAFYQVVSGMADGTYIYLQSFKSLADVDKIAPMHEGDTYRNAVGDAGRSRQLDATRAAVEWSMDVVLAFSAKMSYVPKHWVDADPEFWAPKPAAPKKPAEKK